MLKISDNQKQVLECLASYGDDHVPYFKTIAQLTGLDYRHARIACRALARKGLTELQRGLMDDDGMLAGSGYIITKEGLNFVQLELPLKGGGNNGK